MAKYSKGAQKGVESAMKRMEKGTLESGNSGKKVSDKKQAIAIGLSEARKKGAKVPVKKSISSKKAVPKKTAPAKKAAPKKVVLKKSAPKKAATKKSAPKKSAGSKKAIPKKASPVKKAAAKNVITAKKAAPKSTTASSGNSKEPVVNPSSKGNGMHQPSERGHQDIGNQIPDGEHTAMPVVVEDPVRVIDQKVFNKATSKKDPKHNMPVSSTPKGGIKASGKKPLW